MQNLKGRVWHGFQDKWYLWSSQAIRLERVWSDFEVESVGTQLWIGSSWWVTNLCNGVNSIKQCETEVSLLTLLSLSTSVFKSFKRCQFLLKQRNPKNHE